MKTVPYFIGVPRNKTLEEFFSNKPYVFVQEPQGGTQIVKILQNQNDVIDPVTNTYQKPNFVCMFFKVADNIALGAWLSTAANNKWNVWAIMPLGFDKNGDGLIDHEEWRAGTKVFRRLKRIRNAASNTNDVGELKMLGPWSAKKLWQNYSATVDNLFYAYKPKTFDAQGMPKTFEKDPTSTFHLPWVLLGQVPEKMSDINYDPPDADSENDVEAEETVIFPVTVVEPPV